MALNDADLFLVNQGGESKKITYQNLKLNLNADEALWELDGDNIQPKDDSHNVEIGGGDIQLNADGSAEFAGGITRITTAGVPFSNFPATQNDGFLIQKDSNTTFVIQTDGTTRIGPDASPTIRLDATGRIECGSDNSNPSIEIESAAAPGTNLAINSITQGARTFSVDSNGQISSTSTSISQLASERRVKKDIELIDPTTAWDTIKSVPYYAYQFIETGIKSYGPIVDEMPDDLVVEGQTSDEQGNIRTYDNGLLQARLYVALQESLKRIETLEATNASLEARLTALEGGN
jgi:hypothetical protein